MLINEPMNPDYVLDNELVARRGKLYVQLWGREPEFVGHQTDAEVPHIDVYRFPPTHDESCPMLFRNVYVTAGMSDVPMSVPDRLADSIPSRIEISAYSDEVIMMENGKMEWLTTHLGNPRFLLHLKPSRLGGRSFRSRK